uniref:Uncharacterized protein n=1 Tax=Mucochytrium quahogii TaxID=96639 RepID=A0A7S2WLK6_9STRA|mmetsp:Transcript_7963/g.12875  ORF Transcript_7963/g.12875 Transcript_7963/m.12875 type:complete len:528 (+) Transcript_7963:239-1822(+)
MSDAAPGGKKWKRRFGLLLMLCVLIWVAVYNFLLVQNVSLRVEGVKLSLEKWANDGLLFLFNNTEAENVQLYDETAMLEQAELGIPQEWGNLMQDLENATTVSDGKLELDSASQLESDNVSQPKEEFFLDATESNETIELIPVAIRFHNVISENVEPMGSLLSLDSIAYALGFAKKIWATAGIDLQYTLEDSVRNATVTPQQEGHFRQHMLKFPTDNETGQAWTTLNPGNLNVVTRDLMRCLPVVQGFSLQNVWSKNNEIHVYAMGIFVGYNGLSMNKNIFIRTRKYHGAEGEMDIEQFARILTHEIGHWFTLRHPLGMSDSNVCALNNTMCPTADRCNLMCQQRYISEGIDPRNALYLTPEQASIARRAAALKDRPIIRSVPPSPEELVFNVGPPIESLINPRKHFRFTARKLATMVMFKRPHMGMHFRILVVRFKFSLQTLQQSDELLLKVINPRCGVLVEGQKIVIPEHASPNRHIHVGIDHSRGCKLQNQVVAKLILEFSRPVQVVVVGNRPVVNIDIGLRYE